MCKFLKKLLQWIQLSSFLGPKWFICPNQIFFWKKVINIIFIYLLAPFTLQNFELLEPIQGYDDVPFLGPKYPNLSWTNFFGTNHYYHFHLPIGTFHWAKFKKKNSYSWSRVVRMRHFWAKNILFAPSKTFFWKNINITLTYLLVPFIVQNLKKILHTDPEFRGCTSFGTKMAHFPKWEFFSENLSMSLISFIHAYLNAKNQSLVFIYKWNIDD